MNRTERWIGCALLAAFFCSGVAGLGYQVAWAKAFSAGVGHEFPATLAVITAFMSGLAFGAWAHDRLPPRIRLSRSLYARLEFLIAIWGVLTVVLIPIVNRLTIKLLGLDPTFAQHWGVVFVVAFATLLPATAAMGATLPALERLLALQQERRRVAMLYAANTAGAVLGSLACAYFVLPAFGIKGGILFFVGCNLASGLIAIFTSSTERSVGTTAKRVDQSFPPRLRTALIGTGLLGIGFETTAIRALSHVLENTVFTFAVVIAVYLLGTAVGAAVLARVQARKLLLTLGCACALSGIILRWSEPLYSTLRQAFGDSMVSVAAAEFLVAATVLLLPTAVMGATFTAFAQESLAFRRTLSASVALNAFGAALAPGLFGLMIIPQGGLKLALAMIAAGYFALSGGKSKWFALGAVAIYPLLTSSSDLVQRSKDESIVFHRDGVMGSVTVLESTNGARVLKVSNRFQMGGTAARSAEARHAIVPLLLHPDPRKALFIGLGTGITFATAGEFSGLQADGVELLPEVVEAMPLFQRESVVLRSSQLHVHVADGRRFVSASSKEENLYDVIVGDLFHPAQDGAAFLYSQEHFAAVRRRLAIGGLFCQWLPLYQMDLRTFDIVAETFRTIFPVSEVWLLRFNVDTPVVGLIGWTEEPRFAPDLVERKIASSDSLREQLRNMALGDTLRLLGCRLGRIAPKDVPLNTDDRPVVLFEAPRLGAKLRDDPGARLRELVSRFPVENEFGSAVRQYALARNIYLGGLEAESKGELSQAVGSYIESARLSPEFTAGYAQAIGIATALSGRDPKAAESILRQLVEAQPNRPVARQLLERLQ